MMVRWLLVGAMVCLASLSQSALTLAGEAAPPEKTDVDNSTWGLTFSDFFDAGKPLNMYPSRREGKWVWAIGTSRIPGRNRYGWNTGRYFSDMAGVTVTGDAIKGTFEVTLSPDPWVPADRKPRKAVIEIDAKLTAPDPKDAKAIRGIAGTYKAKLDAGINLRDKERATEISGSVSGGVGPTEIPDLAAFTYQLMFEDIVPGGTPSDQQRRLAVNLGIGDGKVVSAEAGPVNLRHAAYDLQPFEPPANIALTKDTIAGTLTVPFISLDGEPVAITIEVKGGRVQGLLAGSYAAKSVSESGKKEERAGCWGGGVRTGLPDIVYAKDDRPWFVPVKDWKPVAPGEHPRLFFRKSDVPELRRRAGTPEGKLIVARLKRLLGGGDEMPTSLNPAKKAYDDNKFKRVEGSYTICHAAGFGFLYQLTGERKHADLARKCVELALAGQRDADDRYAWAAPGGELRAGPSIGWYAVAYDLCYEAWDEAFRVKFAQAIQNYDDKEGGEWGKAQPEGISLRRMALTPKLGPNSNHYGAVAGGCGLAVLAIQGDPGTDAQLLDIYDEALQRNIPRALNSGFGDGGFFFEGHGPGQIASDTAYIPYLEALRTAQGRDYIAGPRPNAANVTMLRVWELIGPPAVYPYRGALGGTYGGPDFYRLRHGLSRGGQFVQGFGAVPDAMKPALLWCYSTFVDPKSETPPCDTVSPYPHRPMLALINWPFGLEPKNPGDVLPKVHRDSVYEYFVFRNRWQDNDDIVVTALLNGFADVKPRDVMAWGLGGLRLSFTSPARGRVKEMVAGADRSGVISTGESSLAVDFSKASGADALIVVAPVEKGEPRKVSDPKAKVGRYEAGKTGFHVMTLSASGQHPEVKVEGDALLIGKQSVRFDGKKIVLGVFTLATP
ncbi:MAG TPA: hypothetical protein VNE39_27195 [Planctomycetota bacterium]|nr:hypothetical protein [Planctomycetota bacterium]